MQILQTDINVAIVLTYLEDSYLENSHLEDIDLRVMMLDYLEEQKLSDSAIIICCQNRILETFNDFIYILIFNFVRYTSGILSADSEPYCQWTS